MLRRRRRTIAEINVVPYIDVMLVLLIIMMVASPAVNPGQIDLPSVGQNLNTAVAPLEVRIKEDGSLLLVNRQAGGAEKPTTRQKLVADVRAIVGKKPDQAVVISADKNLRYDDVMKTLDVLQQSGIKRVGLLAKQGK
jgi:biopolymer transport protein TolR